MDIGLVLSLLVLILVFILLLYKIITQFRYLGSINNNKRKNLYIIILVALIALVMCLILVQMISKSKVNELFNQNGGKREQLLDICGLPKNYRETNHCFNDGTHHTCCMLGPKAKAAAKRDGNNIKDASEKAFKHKNGKKHKKGELTPWCTCFGSGVCSEYSKKYNDGTHIKFINDPTSDTRIAKKPSNACEKHFRSKFSVRKHGTPGIEHIHTGECDHNKAKTILGSIYDFN